MERHNGIEHIIERRMLLWHALARAARERETPLGPEPRYRFITISRDAGSLGDGIAHELATLLRWHVFDKELVNYIAQNAHVRENLVQQLDERSQNLIHAAITGFLRMAEWACLGEDEYRCALLKTLIYIASQGQCILVGRGANFALGGEPAGLHVRITASPQIRAERLRLEWDVTAAEAWRRMSELDTERRNFIRHHFRRDIDDPHYYDLIFNTGAITAQQVVASITAAIHRAEQEQAQHAMVVHG